MTYRSDLDALAAHHDALADEVAAKQRELEAHAAVLAEARARAKLPVLPNIRIASPCTKAWKDMAAGDGGRVRRCGECNKDVYNVSSMTRDEAEALVSSHHGSLCVRYFQRADGTILLADCEVGVNGVIRKQRNRWIAVGVGALLAGGMVAAAWFTRSGADNQCLCLPESVRPDSADELPSHADVHEAIGGAPAPHVYRSQRPRAGNGHND